MATNQNRNNQNRGNNQNRYAGRQTITPAMIAHPQLPEGCDLSPESVQTRVIQAKGDLAKISLDELAVYYRLVCESVGLNPATNPLDYVIDDRGAMRLYARRDSADQLRAIHNISLEVVGSDITEMEACFVVKATKPEKNGAVRVDTDYGVVPLSDKDGNPYAPAFRANSIMRAVTKAKRRVTLSICGLGFLDETEVEDAPTLTQVSVDQPAQPDYAEQEPEPEPEPEQTPEPEPEQTPEPEPEQPKPITKAVAKAKLKNAKTLDELNSIAKSLDGRLTDAARKEIKAYYRKRRDELTPLEPEQEQEPAQEPAQEQTPEPEQVIDLSVVPENVAILLPDLDEIKDTHGMAELANTIALVATDTDQALLDSDVDWLYAYYEVPRTREEVES